MIAVLFQVGPCETGTVPVGGSSFKEVRMITEISREKLIEVGSRFRANYLVDQSGYTLGLAALDGKPLYELLPDGFKDEVEAAVGKVDAARKDKALMKAESEHATDVQNEAFKQAKVWRRKVAKRAKNAVERGKSMPDGLVKISHARTVPALQGQLTEMVKLLEANIENLHGANLDKLLEEGKKLEAELRQKDATQEVKRLKELPDAVKEFYFQKGLLYTGLKMVNNAGHELWSNDASLAARYHMDILNRRGGTRKADAPPPAAEQNK